MIVQARSDVPDRSRQPSSSPGGSIANPVAHAGTQLGALQRVKSWKTFEESLSRAARDAALELRQAADALRRVDTETIHPDADLCLRWMAARVLELGWNKEQFGDQFPTSSHPQ